MVGANIKTTQRVQVEGMAGMVEAQLAAARKVLDRLAYYRETLRDMAEKVEDLPASLRQHIDELLREQVDRG